jgi:antagonist of KipI
MGETKKQPLFRVLQPGLMTTVQGLGRAGWQRYGIAVGGAMDRSSLRIANALVRNPADTPALEITLTGPVLEVLADCVLAATGAEMSIAVDGALLPNWHSFRVSAGSLITFGRRRSGARVYLAAAGGVRRTEKAENPRLTKGDLLLRDHAPTATGLPLLHLPPSEQPAFFALGAEGPTAVVLRAIEGPHWSRFSDAGQHAFLTQVFEVNHDSNRAGIRLIGQPLELAPGQAADIISEPTPLGTVQVPASGQPIILMTDRPTTGGYAKIATVIAADIPRAAQLAPGDIVRFQTIPLDQAQHAAIDLETHLRLLERVATWSM